MGKMPKTNEEVLKEILEQSLAGYWDWDISTGYEYLSPSFKKMFGYEDHEIENRAESWQKLIFPEDLPGVFEKFNQHVESKGTIPYYNEIRYHHKNGSTVWVICTGKVIEWDEDGNAKRMIGCHIDITDRKQAEISLQESENRFHDLFEKAPLGYQSLDIDGKFIEVNHAWLETFGYKREEVIGKWFGDFLAPEYVQAFRDRFPIFKAQGKIHSEFFMVHKDGNKRYITFDGRIGHNANGSFKQTHCILKDETERKTVQEDLVKSEIKYRTIVENVTDALYIHDFNGCIIDCNDAACRMSGYSRDELIGHSLSMLDSDENKRLLPDRMQRLLQENMIIFEGSHIRKDGSTVPIEVCGKVVSRDNDGIIQGFVRDVTARKRAEEVLVRTQKLESLGVLASGIAHDFNNLLGGIFASIDMARVLTKDEHAAAHLAKAVATIDRVRGLTKQLLTFAKGGAPVKRVEQLSHFVEETARFALSGSSVSLSVDVRGELSPCSVDRNQIGQVIENIVINAQQAMPSGGTIELSAENRELREHEHAPLPAGRYVCISVTDHGVGIPKELRNRIFDPFFTTKSMGHGLGLATCYSIINKHGGYIDVDSEPGRGTSVHVYLPAVDALPEPVKKSAGKHNGSGTFIIMDDEEIVREAVGETLAVFGYSVVLKEHGRAVLDFLSSCTADSTIITAMIFDLTIPGGLGGKDIIAKIRDQYPHTPIFVASGYADDPVIADPQAYGFTASIGKPFTLAELAALLNEHIPSGT